MTLEDLEAHYNTSIPFTEYYGLIKAIPKKRKLILANKDLNSEDTEDYKLIDMNNDSPHPCQLLYKSFMNNKFIAPTSKAIKW